jgi:hypothetical protein
LAQMIEDLIDDPKRRHVLGRHAQQVRHRYSEPVVRSEFLSALAPLLP